MRRPPPRSTRTATLVPYTTLFRSQWPRFGIVPNRSVRINLVSRLIEYSHLCGCPKFSVRRRPDFCRDIKPSGSVQLIYLVNLHDVTTAALTTAATSRHGALHDLTGRLRGRSEEHTSELQSLMRISYAVFCLKKKILTNELTKHQLHKLTKIE